MNGDLTPDDVSPGSNKPVTWLGACGHHWDDLVAVRTLNGTGCEVCTGYAVRPGVNDLGTTHPALALEWDVSNSLLPTEVRAGSHERVLWKCAGCERRWPAAVRDRAGRGTGCTSCTNVGTSKAERYLFEAVANWLDGAEHNVRLPGLALNGRRMTADIVGDYDGRPVVIEYDGSFWHAKGQGRDIAKTDLLIAAGYTVVRVREGKLGFLPAREGLFQAQVNYIDGNVEKKQKRYDELGAQLLGLLAG